MRCVYTGVFTCSHALHRSSKSSRFANHRARACAPPRLKSLMKCPTVAVLINRRLIGSLRSRFNLIAIVACALLPLIYSLSIYFWSSGFFVSPAP